MYVTGFSAKLAAVILLLVPASGVGQCRYRSQAKKLPAGLKLAVSTETPVARISQPFTVHVELTNQSGAPISIEDRLSAERDYELHLFDLTGKEAPLTEQARRMRFWPIHGSMTIVELAPGKTIGFDENLANIYAVSEPGDYTLEACRDIQGIGNLYSNKLVLPFTH
jgi:hypothetical protein